MKTGRHDSAIDPTRGAFNDGISIQHPCDGSYLSTEHSAHVDLGGDSLTGGLDFEGDPECGRAIRHRPKFA